MDDSYDFEFAWLLERWPLLLSGAEVTIKLMAITAVTAFAIGLVTGQMRMAKSRLIRLPIIAYIDFFRTTPPLVQIVFFFFFLPIFLGIRTDAFTAGFVALSLNYGAFFAEIFRAGVTSLGRGQREAAFALGMTGFQAARRVIYPQAVRRMLPPIGGMFVSLIKDTSLVAVLGVPELMNTAQTLGAETFRNLEVLLVVACIYFVITYPVALGANWVHDRVSKHV